MNKETAVAQQGLNSTNQITPFGNLTYEQIGKWEDGTPRFQATQSLSPENKALYDKYMGIAGQMGTMGGNLASNASASLSQPFKLGNEETESRLMELGQKRLDPLMQRRRESTEADLINRGVRPGSEAYERMMGNVGEQENDAYNQLLLTGRGQAAQESQAERNQSLNELNAMLAGTQVQGSNFTNTPNSQVSGVDYAGLVNNQYNQKTAQYNGMLGGIGSLVGQAGGWGMSMMSDRRLKTDEQIVGKLDNGLPVYLYRYKAGGPFMLGLMADEVKAVNPRAVTEADNGFDAVDYELAVM